MRFKTEGGTIPQIFHEESYNEGRTIPHISHAHTHTHTYQPAPACQGGTKLRRICLRLLFSKPLNPFYHQLTVTFSSHSQSCILQLPVCQSGVCFQLIAHRQSGIGNCLLYQGTSALPSPGGMLSTGGLQGNPNKVIIKQKNKPVSKTLTNQKKCPQGHQSRIH